MPKPRLWLEGIFSPVAYGLSCRLCDLQNLGLAATILQFVCLCDKGKKFPESLPVTMLQPGYDPCHFPRDELARTSHLAILTQGTRKCNLPVPGVGREGEDGACLSHGSGSAGRGLGTAMHLAFLHVSFIEYVVVTSGLAFHRKHMALGAWHSNTGERAEHELMCPQHSDHVQIKKCPRTWGHETIELTPPGCLQESLTTMSKVLRWRLLEQDTDAQGRSRSGENWPQ